MRVFISWSGDLSKELAEALRRWLPSALQFVKPYFTPADVDKGARWATEISKELSESKFGIIVLTPDNLRSPWINFEAGAISRTIEQSNVCPIVFGMEPTDVEWPLAQFQATRFNRDDIHQLFNTINAAGGESRLSHSVAQSVFDKWWPDLENEVARIEKDSASCHAPGEVRPDRDLIEEVLSLVRGIQNRQEEIEYNRQMAQGPGGGLIPGQFISGLGTYPGSGPYPGAAAPGPYPWLTVRVPGIAVAENPMEQAFRGARDKVAAIKTAETNAESPRESKKPDS